MRNLNQVLVMTYTRLTKTIFSLLLLFPASLQAGGNNAAAELYMKIERIEFLSASFQQTVKDHEGYVTQELGGQLKLARPNKVYWETFPPYEQIVVANEERVWIYDPDLEQVTVQSSGPSLDGPLVLLSESLEALREKYEVSREASDIGDAFSLTPHVSDQESSFAQLRFGFVEDSLQTITITDKLRQTTNIKLSELSVNTPVPDETFIFTVPEGVDTVVNE